MISPLPELRYYMRKSMLYKTGVEYGDYTINHVLGCSHGCTFPCYAFTLAKRFGRVKTYDQWCSPVLAQNALDLVKAELPKLIDKIKSVQLCFTTDPFMFGYDEISEVSIAIINEINRYDIPCTILTKGILPDELRYMSRQNSYGITLVSLDENFRDRYEPRTAKYEDRIEALRKLHEDGFKTWVSIEPYPTPNIVDQDYSKILNEISFVDKIIFGRLNYNSKVSAYRNNKLFYNQHARQTIDFCQSNGIEYHIKNGTII